MTMIPTPEQIAESQRQMDAITIRAGEQRIALLERLIQKYATHVVHGTGVYLLEDRFRQSSGASYEFTDEEWAEIRLIAKETE